MHTLKISFTYILSKETTGGSAHCKKALTGRELEGGMQDTGCPAPDKDGRKFQHESEWKVRKLRLRCIPQGNRPDWSKRIRVPASFPERGK